MNLSKDDFFLLSELAKTPDQFQTLSGNKPRTAIQKLVKLNLVDCIVINMESEKYKITQKGIELINRNYNY